MLNFYFTLEKLFARRFTIIGVHHNHPRHLRSIAFDG
jgi:hypothetical protein